MFKNKYFNFIFWLFVGLTLSISILYFNNISKNSLNQYTKYPKNDKILTINTLYNESVAEDLYPKIRVLCWVMTTPNNHKTKAIHVKNTWGKRCNKLIFMSSEEDTELGSVALPVKEGRKPLWDKTKHAFLYIYQHHFHEADWFLKADDDSYMFMENVRRMLYQYRPETALYFGDRFAVKEIPEGYMAGGGYILSKKALEKFVIQTLPNSTICNRDENGNEDWELGICLKHSALSADDRDEFQQKRMFALSILYHVGQKDMKFWYDQRMYYDVVRGNLNCCSQYPVGFHYINEHEMYFLEYLTRKVYPFGYDKKINETLPRKFRFEEVVAQSDYESKSPLFVQHPKIHYFDHGEKY